MMVERNISVLNTLNTMNKTSSAQSNVMKKLSSGKRINNAADDPNGTAKSETIKAQIRGLEQAYRNTQDGVSLTQTAQGGIDNIQNMTHRLKELCVQAANDILTSEDREIVAKEINQINEGITQIAQDTTFNEKNLLATIDVPGEGIVIHISAQPSVSIMVERNDITAASLGTTAIDVSSAAAASASITIVDRATEILAAEQTKYGAYQQNLEQIAVNLSIYTENTTGANSRLVDANMTLETIKLSKYDLLNASTNLIMSQARERQINVLELLK